MVAVQEHAFGARRAFEAFYAVFDASWNMDGAICWANVMALSPSVLVTQQHAAFPKPDYRSVRDRVWVPIDGISWAVKIILVDPELPVVEGCARICHRPSEERCDRRFGGIRRYYCRSGPTGS